MDRPFYTRELAQKFEYNFQKWQRWTREFLPAETIKGLPKGYQREYTPKEAFTVYLGGHLVSEMGFSIVDAKEIVNDLIPWMDDVGLIPLASVKPGEQKLKGAWKLVTTWKISIAATDKPLVFIYIVRGFIYEAKTVEHEGFEVQECRFKTGNIPKDFKKEVKAKLETSKTLELSRVINKFITSVMKW